MSKTLANNNLSLFHRSLDWSPTNDHLPKISYVNIKSPGNVEAMIGDYFGNGEFWDSLPINEDKFTLIKDEL